MAKDFNEPIVAISTSPGNAGVGIIRISGGIDAISQIIDKVFFNKAFEPRKAHLKKIRDQNGNLIDNTISILFPAPNSYTGETILEIQAHGGQVLLTWILEILLDVGKEVSLRLAKPGEFTERAFLNGKIDLVQAEAIADLIDASSRSAVKAASLSLKGEFSKHIYSLRDELIRLRVEVEAILDFPEEEIDFISEYNCKERVASLDEKLSDILNMAEQGEALRDGYNVALIGQTNVGKSSLLNCLAQEELAIVSDVAGTTRDKIKTLIHVNGVPFFITDTAGIRETEDKVEKIGIERSKDEIRKADIILHIVDAREPENSKDDVHVIELVKSLAEPSTPMLTVINKSDLVEPFENVSRETTILTSAKTGSGIPTLKEKLLKIVGWKERESVFIARERHIRNLRDAQEHIKTAVQLISSQQSPLELFAEELKLAGDALGEIVGKTASDDLLGLIFKGFCIGK